MRGHIDDSFLTDSLTGAFSGPSFTADGFGQDRLTVLAGRLPARSATNQIVLTPRIAAFFGVGVGGRVTYQFYRQNLRTGQAYPTRRATFDVTGIVDIPPVLVDQSDEKNSAVLPPGGTRRVLASYEFAWAGVRLDRGAAGIPSLQRHLATLAASLQRLVLRRDHLKLPNLTLSINRSDITHAQVQQAIRPQAIALAVFGAITALAMLVLVGQGIAQLLSRSAPGISAARALGATRAQAALAVSLPAAAAILTAMVLAVAGAVLLSPLAPVGPVRRFDPARGFAVDGLVIGAGSVLLTAVLAGLLAVMAARAVRPHAGRAGQRRPSPVRRRRRACPPMRSWAAATRCSRDPASGACGRRWPARPPP